MLRQRADPDAKRASHRSAAALPCCARPMRESMAFQFNDLDDETRHLMLAELDLDEATGLYGGPRLNAAGAAAWPGLLRDAMVRGNEASLVADLGQPGGPYLNLKELNPSTGALTKDVPVNAAATLGQGEFNRFYMRALCLRAISEDRILKIYRARHSDKPSPSSENKIGLSVDPSELLDDLRANKGAATVHGLGLPNSGLSVELT